MPNTGLQSFDRTVHEVNGWLKEVMEELGIEERHRAYRVLKGVLHALRDRMTVDEATQFGAQLPMLMRGFYYEGWRPADVPLRVRGKEEFLDVVDEELRDLREDGPDLDTEEATTAVFSVIERHVSQGEIADVIHHMPKQVKEMWSPEARAA